MVFILAASVGAVSRFTIPWSSLSLRDSIVVFDLIRFGFLRGSPLTSPCAVAGRDAAFKGFGSRQDGCRIPECFAEATF